MEILNKNQFKAWEDIEIIRIAMSHQNHLLEIRNNANSIDLKNFNIGELVTFVKRCREITK